MPDSRIPAQAFIFSLLIATSLLTGWFIPAFYEWTGSDQSRAAPVVGQTALALIIAAAVVWLALPWFPLEHVAYDHKRASPVRFSVRTLLMVTTAVGIILAGLLRFPTLVSSGLCEIAVLYAVWFGIANRPYRLATAALLSCMVLPYIWILAAYDELTPEILWMALGLPTFVPTVLACSLAGQHPQEMFWLSMLLTSAELLAGVWIIRLGPRRTVAYLVFVLLMSLFGSFGLNALLRA